MSETDIVERVARVLCLHPDPDTMVPGVVVTKMEGGFSATFNGPLEPAWFSHINTASKVIEAMRSEWQPIETAPKDGSVVDLWVPSYRQVNDYLVEGHRVAACRWNDGWGDGGFWEAKFVEVDSFTPLDSIDGQQPTHWMPLPEPPSIPTEKDTR
jgi:hypothetical protein